MPVPLVSYLVITRDRRDELRRCLDSLDRQRGPASEIVVVDNGSADGTPDWLRSERPDVVLVDVGANSGASGGRNRGLAVARGAYVISIDDDAELRGDDVAAKVVERFEADEKLGVISFKILEPATGLEERKSIPRRDKKRIDQDFPTTYFCTAGCAFRREALPQGEVFWERLVIYGEELDLAYRILQRGWGMVRANDLTVLHHETPRARPPARFFYRMIRNRLPIALRSLPPLAVASTFVIWVARMTLLSAQAGALPACFLGVIDSLRDVRPALELRDQLSDEAVSRLEKNFGRLWY